ncbi:MAG: type II secretion system protein [Aquabacterium sp.]|uniref:type II secretion system protein n=1 Tax=Aquabacterium sp. TaxID=1872578 RepID=UPI003BAE15F6
MRTGDPGTSRGFTYLALLWWVAISGVMLAALGTQWKLEATRQREAELVFRGGQIQAALAAYQANTPAGQPNLPLTLTELLDDERQGPAKRHLRRAWADPVTSRPWGLLRTQDGRIRGVYSESARSPLTAPEGVQAYREWLFDVAEIALPPADAASSAGPAAQPSPSGPLSASPGAGQGPLSTAK